MKQKDLQQHLEKVKDYFSKELLGLRTGRASTSLVEDIKVSAYEGSDPLPLIELASISVPEPQTILISPWDKSVLKKIEDAISASEKNLNPVNDGTSIRVPVPALTAETRKEIVKDISKHLEEAKISVRTLRQDAMKAIEEMEREGVISEDEMHKEKKLVEESVSNTNKELEGIAKKKEEEVLTF